MFINISFSGKGIEMSANTKENRWVKLTLLNIYIKFVVLNCIFSFPINYLHPKMASLPVQSVKLDLQKNRQNKILLQVKKRLKGQPQSGHPLEIIYAWLK